MYSCSAVQCTEGNIFYFTLLNADGVILGSIKGAKLYRMYK